MHYKYSRVQKNQGQNYNLRDWVLITVFKILPGVNYFHQHEQLFPKESLLVIRN